MVRSTKKGGYIVLVEGIIENERIKPRYSFIKTSKEWISSFENEGCKHIYHEKKLNTFLLEGYINYRDKALQKIKALLGIKTPQVTLSNCIETYDYLNENKPAEKKQKFRMLKNIYRTINNFILFLLVYLSYPLEYLNNYLFKRYGEGVGAFLFIKK